MYIAADSASRRSQNLHFFSFAIEFSTLILVAILNVRLNGHEWHAAALVLSLVAFAFVAIGRRLTQWERKWYQSRALAESVKTTAWRYAMRAEPFDSSDQEATKRFREYLAGILRANRQLGTIISANDVADDQVTEDMRSIRKLTVHERIERYTKSRVENQQEWYSSKSRRNSKVRNLWSVVIAIVFLALLLLVFGERVAPEVIAGNFDGLLVLCTAMIGWVEVKRYNELAASYGITSHEIGIIKSKVEIVQDDDSLSAYVNETERAFSREHTQWLARSQVEL
jgi:hypothetical protein